MTITQTQTATTTSVSTATTTAVSTSTATSTATTTTTKTIGVPIPGPTGSPKDPKQQTCFTPQCIILSSSILSALDTTQDPCENFYDFANGGWLKNHPIPSDKGSVGNFELLAQQNKLLLQQILSEDSSSIYSEISKLNANTDDDPYERELLYKIRTLYSSCMDEDLLEARGSAPLTRVISTIRDLFDGKTEFTNIQEEPQEKNVDPDEDKRREGLTAAVAYLHSRGINALFGIDVEGDVGQDPNFMTLYFGQPPLGLPSKEYYEDESITSLYQRVIERLLITLYDEGEKRRSDAAAAMDAPGLVVHEERLSVWPPWPWPPWGGDDDDDDGGDHDGGGGGDDDGGHKHKPVNRTKEARKLAQHILTFEKKIANASLDLDIIYQDPVATYNPVPIRKLTSDLPEINFNAYFSTFAPRNYPERVILDSVKFPAALSDIIYEAPTSVLQAYLEIRAALTLAPHLSVKTEAWKATRSLEEALRGIKPGAIGDRAEYCVGRVETAMGFAAGRYFVQEVFGGDSRVKGTRVITDIVDAFKQSLKDIQWMDRKSSRAAAEKADAIRVKVGYPLSPDTRNPRSLVSYYGLVEIHESTFFENMISASASDEVKRWYKLGKQRNREEWEMYPSMVNAYFNPPANEIVFPAGIMQPPFFSKDWPNYMAYAAFGAVAAHELTHAFDSAGRLYNQNGKLEQWWTDETSAGFNEKQKCIVKQFSSYSIDDGKGGKVHVNGNMTSGENIGDTGLIQAYRAWKAQYDKEKPSENEALLPGLDFTREQLFWIAFGHIWAQNIKPASALARVRSDPHSPNRYRVEGTLYNIPEFAEAFKCSPRAKLNPPNEKRCLFWS